MKRHLSTTLPGFLLFLILTACAKPIAYMNNIPRASGLKEKGDINANLDFNPDPKIIQTGMTWSPIHHIGIGGDYFLNISRHDQLNYAEARLLYYIPLKKNTQLEFGIAFGKGNIVDERASRNTLTGISMEHQVRTNYLTRSIQFNYSPYDDGIWQMHLGIRLRNLIFDKYSYLEYIDGDEKSYINNSRWNVLILDPFFELNKKYNKLTLNCRISSPLTILKDRSIPKSHPVQNLNSMSVGIIYDISSQNQ